MVRAGFYRLEMCVICFCKLQDLILGLHGLSIGFLFFLGGVLGLICMFRKVCRCVLGRCTLSLF